MGEIGHHISNTSKNQDYSTCDFPSPNIQEGLIYKNLQQDKHMFYNSNSTHHFWFMVTSLKYKKTVLHAPNIIKITSSCEALSESYKLLVEIILSTSTSINMALRYKQFSCNKNVKKHHWGFIK